MSREISTLENKLQTFSNEEFGSVRVVVIDGEPWFVGKDVCEAFGDSNYRRSLARLDEYEKGVSQMSTSGGMQLMTIVNEGGLYSLLFYMQPQKAKGVSQNDVLIQERINKLRKFKYWVTHEVLPTIRKHGAYMTSETMQKALSNPDFIIELAQKLKNEQEANKKLHTENSELKIANKMLTEDINTWDDRSIITSLIRKYASVKKNNVFAYGWHDFYKRLAYKNSINLKSKKAMTLWVRISVCLII